MSKKHRAPSTTPHQEHVTPGLVSVALLTGAVRHIGAVLIGLAVTWWQHD
ncbi:hypothetical protein [Streptomyces sp. LUP30]|nr:hypothetical protein [Streptomyces sp. LUP30]